MKQKRGYHAAVSIGESIFVLGGWSGSHLKSVEMYDIRSNQWIQIIPMNTIRSGLSVVSIDNSIFVIGGYDSQQPLKTVETLQL